MSADHNVQFKRAKDRCCNACNPVNVADAECDVIESSVSLFPFAQPVALCMRCIKAFASAARDNRRKPKVELDPEVVELSSWAARRRAAHLEEADHG